MGNKRGVSPVVATVILISIVVVIAIIIFIWARAFLGEAARKGDRAVEVSCGKVEFQYQLIQSTEDCIDVSGGSSALDINNIGNVPIYGLRVLEWDDTTGSVAVDEVFPSGTITIGKSASICLKRNINTGNSFRVVPKLLAEDAEGKKSVYTCPEKDGITISYTGV